MNAGENHARTSLAPLLDGATPAWETGTSNEGDRLCWSPKPTNRRARFVLATNERASAVPCTSHRKLQQSKKL